MALPILDYVRQWSFQQGSLFYLRFWCKTRGLHVHTFIKWQNVVFYQTSVLFPSVGYVVNIWSPLSPLCFYYKHQQILESHVLFPLHNFHHLLSLWRVLKVITSQLSFHFHVHYWLIVSVPNLFFLLLQEICFPILFHQCVHVCVCVCVRACVRAWCGGRARSEL
jgi:hypothetical protein